MTHWEPPADLTRLLEALAGEIVGATDEEMQVANAPTFDSVRASLMLVLRMRDLIGEAIDEPTELNNRLPLLEREARDELRHRPN